MHKLLGISVIAVCVLAARGQAPPPTILEIDMENVVTYVDDVADPAKKATSPSVSPLPSGFIITFKSNLTEGDIVAVSGKPAKGLAVVQFQPRPAATTGFTSGRSIADIAGGCQIQAGFMIIQPDGTPIGTIMATGTTALGPPPGAPTSATSINLAVVGGTGAFLGVRGQASVVRSSGVRSASMTEDPAYRRVNGGGTQRYVIHLIPMTWPEVLAIPTGPAIFHAADFSPVTSEKAARAGEQLMMSVSGLGPVRPKLDPGTPFPPFQEGKEYVVNSPVEVTVNGKAAQVVNALGWPGLNNVYRVDFVVPDGTAAGTATLGLSVAWINGPEVKIPVR